MRSIANRFSHLILLQEDVIDGVVPSVPWMPSLIKNEQLFLGKHEQAEDRTVISGLKITHVLSIGRYESEIR